MVFTGLRDMPVSQQIQLPTLSLPKLGALFTMLATGPSPHDDRLVLASDSAPQGRPGPRRLMAPAWSYTGPLVMRDRQNEWTVKPTVDLIHAFRRDYTKSKSYLQETEGQAIAERLGAQVEVFTQPDRRLPSIHYTWTLGTGARGKDALLFVGRNHYVVLTELADKDPTQADAISHDGRRFRSGQKTVSDGNCLIDGLLIITGMPHGDKELLMVRSWLQDTITDDHIAMMLEGLVNGMLAGEFPQGAGPDTLRVLREDPNLWPEYTRVVEVNRQAQAAKKDQAAKEKAAKEQAEREALGKDGGAPVKDGAPAKDGAPVSSGAPVLSGAPVRVGAPAKGAIDPAPEFAGMDERRRADLRGRQEGAEGLQDAIEATRKKYAERAASTGAPHVFNKIFGAYADSMADALLEIPGIKASYASEIAGQMQALMAEFEGAHRHHLIAHDLPATSGPDENSLAFGSESQGLSHLMTTLVGYLQEQTTTAETAVSARGEIDRRIEVIQAQMLHLAQIGIDPAAVRVLTAPKNRQAKSNGQRIEAARAFVHNYSGIAAQGMLSKFFADIEQAMLRFNGVEPGKPEAAVPPAKELGAQIIALRTDADAALQELRARQAERAKVAALKTDPDERAVEIVQDIITRWHRSRNEQLNTLSQKRSGRRELAEALASSRRVLTRVMAHARNGVRRDVLPDSASPVGAAKTKGYTDADFPVVNSHEKVKFSSTNARNLAYPDYESARIAALGLLGLGPGAHPHARYSIGPGGLGGPGVFDRPDAPGLRVTDIRITSARTQKEGGNPEEGFVAEYITDDGPMLLAYHSYDCTAMIKVGKEERRPAPHFHVGTLAGNDIDKGYWEPEHPEDRTPQFATDITDSRDSHNKRIRVAKQSKAYVQHDEDHHLYHL